MVRYGAFFQCTRFNDTITVTNDKSSRDQWYDIVDQEKFGRGEIIFQRSGPNNQSKIISLLLCDILSFIILGIADMVVDSINRADIDLRSIMQQNIVLCGETTMSPGFIDRITYELSSHLNVNIKASNNRSYLSFIGSAKPILSASMNNMWITREEYDKEGPSIIHRKCL
jgi:hypothetical protein